jgi:hypothetical protein
VTSATGRTAVATYDVLHHHRVPNTVQRYELKPQTPDEQRAMLEVLHEQMELQRWYVVIVLRDQVAEIAIPVN